MIYRSILSFVTLHRFLAKLRALNLAQFSSQTVFRTFFLNGCRCWPVFWHGSQSSCFTDQVWVSLHSIDCWQNYRPWNLVNFSNQTVFRTFFLNPCRYWSDFWHVSQSPCFTDRVWVLWRSIDFWQNYRPWNLVNFSNQTVFWTFFLNPCRYWADFWHVSQSPCFTDRVWVLWRSIDFWQNYRPWNLVNFSNQTVFRTFFLNPCRYCPDFGHVSQSPWLTDRVWVSLCSIVFGEIMDLGLS